VYQKFGHFTDILGYHESFQIVDYAMANIQKISQSKNVDYVPKSNLWNPIKFISYFIWQS
jgi:hypothetical protein